MKKLLVSALSLMSLSVFAAPEIQNISEGNLEAVANEFAVNFSHTAVAAPETEGVWGVEVGLVAGRTGSPVLADVVDESGEDGGKFKSIYNAGLMARAHFPLDIFAEITALPHQKISEVGVASRSMSLGWNAGAYFGLPLDLAAGISFSNSDVSFKQDISSGGTTVADSKITLDSKTRIMFLAASKRFAFVTPYLKVGAARTESEVKVHADSVTIFAFSSSQKETVHSSGFYSAIGANLQFLVMRFGLEISRTNQVNRLTGKLSVDF